MLTRSEIFHFKEEDSSKVWGEKIVCVWGGEGVGGWVSGGGRVVGVGGWVYGCGWGCGVGGWVMHVGVWVMHVGVHCECVL